MNLEFSCEDDNINVYINNEMKNPNKQQFGKKFYYLDTKYLNDIINLKLTRNGDKGRDYLQFFFFRYTFSNNEINSKYYISNTKMNVTRTFGETTSNYSIVLTPINDYEKYDVTYIIKIINDGTKPKNSYISMKLGNQKVKEFYNPMPFGNSLSLSVTNAIYKADYIQVIVQIKEKEDVEYLSYDLHYFTEKNETDNNNASNKTDNETKPTDNNSTDPKNKTDPDSDPNKNKTEPDPNKNKTEPDPNKNKTEPDPNKNKTEPDPNKNKTEPDPSKSETEPESSQNQTDTYKDDKISKLVLTTIIIGSVLLVIVIILIIIIIIFNKNQKDLMQKVNQISFSDNDRGEAGDNLLSN